MLEGLGQKLSTFTSSLVHDKGLAAHAVFKPATAIHAYFLHKLDALDSCCVLGYTKHALFQRRIIILSHIATAASICLILLPVHLLGLLINCCHALWNNYHQIPELPSQIVPDLPKKEETLPTTEEIFSPAEPWVFEELNEGDTHVE